jgi:hypothetical protein
MSSSPELPLPTAAPPEELDDREPVPPVDAVLDAPALDEVSDGLDRRGPGGRARLPSRSSGRDASAGPTAQLWRRRAPGVPAVAFAVALTGIDSAVLADALSISLAASPEAQTLLDGMELRVRTLTTSVESDTERCIYSVRGPVLWSETITARANALGNDDVFVCATPSRSFDTVENRVLVAALEAIARASRALAGPTGAKVPADDAARIGAIADEARRWRRHPRLAEVRSTRLNGRDMARLRGGHRLSRMAPVFAVRDRVAEPFVPEDLDGLADRWTRRYHGFVHSTLDSLVGRFGGGEELTVSDGGLWADAASFRHPAAPGGTAPGLVYRGIPLLPPESLLSGAPWAAKLRSEGVRINGEGDLRRLMDRLASGPAARRSR